MEYKGYSITDWGTTRSIHSRAKTASIQIRFSTTSTLKRFYYKARDDKAKAEAIEKAKAWIDLRAAPRTQEQ